MAMTASGMATLIVTALKARNPEITGDEETELQAYWEDICGGIVSHIQSSAQVTTSVAVASVSGVTPGGGVSGPGSGTGTGSIS